VLRRVETAALQPWEDAAVLGPLVSREPTPGRITSRSAVPGTDIVSLRLSNGARVLYKQTDFKSDEILFRAVSLGGSSHADDADYISSQFAVDAVEQGGLADYDVDDLRKILTGVTADVEPFLQETYEGLTGSATPADLESLFQLIYLYHREPRRDTGAWDVLMRRTEENLKNRDASPMTVYEDRLWEELYDGHPRSRPVTLERLDEADLDRSLGIYADRFDDAGDFTYVFVGDIDPDRLESLVETWIAGLPAGDVGEGWIDRGMRDSGGVRKVSLEAGAEPLSVVTQVWTGDWDGDFTERYRIQSLASALEMQLTKTIREETGGTYSVGVFPNLSVAPHRDYRFIVRYSCDPERVDELTAMVRRIVADWREAPPDERFATDVVASQRRSLDVNLERNAWWLGQIVFAVATGLEEEDLLDRSALYDTLSPEVLSATARRYLNDEDYLEAVLYPDPDAGS